MTKEEKTLLLRDLCARLPYGVILVAPNGKITYQTDGNTAAELLVEEGWKPYLRPMSSMTEEEKEEFDEITLIHTPWGVQMDRIPKLVDWLNKNMFDYRGLIPMSLALEALERMYL